MPAFYLRKHTLKGKKGKMRKEQSVVEFLYCVRLEHAFSTSIPHNPTDQGTSSFSITEEIEAWKGKVTY